MSTIWERLSTRNIYYICHPWWYLISELLFWKYVDTPQSDKMTPKRSIPNQRWANYETEIRTHRFSRACTSECPRRAPGNGEPVSGPLSQVLIGRTWTIAIGCYSVCIHFVKCCYSLPRFHVGGHRHVCPLMTLNTDCCSHNALYLYVVLTLMGGGKIVFHSVAASKLSRWNMFALEKVTRLGLIKWRACPSQFGWKS